MAGMNDWDARVPSHYRTPLTVTDVERLAKSGVTIAFADIADQIQPDPVKDTMRDWVLCPLAAPFWDRWRRSHPTSELGFGATPPYLIFATAHGEQVHVYVAPTDDKEPFILTDDKALYPSDALMAKLALWERS